MVVVDEENRTLLVVAPEDQLSLAIGRGGQNVRLASVLLGWHIDVKGEQKYAKFIEDGFQSLLAIEGINESISEILYDAGITSSQELAVAEIDQLLELEGFDEERAKALIEAAKVAPAPKEESEEVREKEEEEDQDKGEDSAATDE